MQQFRKIKGCTKEHYRTWATTERCRLSLMLDNCSITLKNGNKSNYKVKFDFVIMHAQCFKLAGHLTAQTKRNTMWHRRMLEKVTFLSFQTSQFVNFAYTDVWLTFLGVLSLFCKLYFKSVEVWLWTCTAAWKKQHGIPSATAPGLIQPTEK